MSMSRTREESKTFSGTGCGTQHKMPSNLHFGPQVVGDDGPGAKSYGIAFATIGEDMQMEF